MKEQFSLEQKLTEIRAIIEQMQKDISDFDQQRELFEKGTRLIRECQEYLNKSELEIKKLIDGEEEPFEDV